MSSSKMYCQSSPQCSNLRMQLWKISNGTVLCHSICTFNGSISDLKNVVPMKMRAYSRSGNREREISVEHYDDFFQCLALLSKGKNVLTISYCCLVEEIEVIYQPRKTDLTVVPVYVVLNGESGQFKAPPRVENSVDSACSRVSTLALTLQMIFAGILNDNGCTGKIFQLEHECEPKAAQCVVFHAELSSEEAHCMTRNELWKRLGKEIMSSEIGSTRKKFFAILPQDTHSKARTEDIAVSGENLALVGISEMHFLPRNAYEILARFRETTKKCAFGPGLLGEIVGTAAHELGHAFGLGHSDGMMSGDFALLAAPFTHTGVNLKSPPILTGSSLILLKHHRWFNSNVETSEFLLSYDENAKLIKSSHGIRVVEIRTGGNEQVVKFWTFEEKKQLFAIPRHTVLHVDEPSVIVVEDDLGNIIKTKF